MYKLSKKKKKKLKKGMRERERERDADESQEVGGAEGFGRANAGHKQEQR